MRAYHAILLFVSLNDPWYSMFFWGLKEIVAVHEVTMVKNGSTFYSFLTIEF